ATLKLVVGDGMDPATDIGALVDASQRDKVLAHIDGAIAEGAVVVAQGILPSDPRLAGGYWVAPTILAGVTPTMAIAQEEVFGPVACIMRFSTEAQAIDICNGTEYGLTAAICTTDVERGRRIARQLQVGMVMINNYM